MYEIIEHDEIDGLYYVENVIEDEKIMTKIDSQSWTPITNYKNSRLVQHYGFYYNYMSKNALKEAPKFPDYIDELKENLEYICKELDLIKPDYNFNQCIINNYYSGQSISKHIDSSIFGNVIGCYTLNSVGVMKFTNGEKSINVKVAPNSLYIMSGDSRYKWTHEMVKLDNERRVSITFRHV